MVKVIIHLAKATVTAIAALLVASCSIGGFKKVDGDGNVVTKNRNITQPFDAVSAGGDIEVIVEQGNSNSVTVSADSNLHEHIITEVENGELNVSCDVSIRGEASKKVIITVATLNTLESSAGVNLKSKNALKQESIALIANSGSFMDVAVEASKTTCETSSGGNMKVSGRAAALEAEASSGSTMDGRALSATTAKAAASSGATIFVNPAEKLAADASSGGHIFYVSTPNKLEKNASSGGEISQQ